MPTPSSWDLVSGGKSGLSVRTIIRNCFDGLRSKNSGAAAPTATLLEGQEFLEIPATGTVRTLKLYMANAWRDLWAYDTATNAFTLLAGTTAFSRSQLAAADAVAGRAALGLIGTVSRSSGVSTGALMQDPITNANGTYWRLANGLQICVTVPKLTGAVNVAAGTNYSSAADVSFTWPAAFVGVPTGDVTIENAGATSVWINKSMNANDALTRAYRSAPTTTSYTIRAYAIGSWF
jgi:hypothetical protein